MKTIKIKLGRLEFDQKLINFRPINTFFVSRYRQAYRAGATFPPVIVEAKTNRITSGNHRVKAMLEEYGPDYEVEVIVKKYASEKEMLVDFVKENVSHGNPLDGITCKRLAIALTNEGASLEEISALFNVAFKRIVRWGEETVGVIGGNGRQETLPVKNAMKPDTVITAAQYEEHRKRDLGIAPERLIDQLIRWLKNEWIERNEVNINALTVLYGLLGEFLEDKPVSKVG